MAQTAIASTRTSTAARPGSGTGFLTSDNSSGPPRTQAFIVLGGLTVLSTIVFRELKNNDGDSVSQHNVM